MILARIAPKNSRPRLPNFRMTFAGTSLVPCSRTRSVRSAQPHIFSTRWTDLRWPMPGLKGIGRPPPVLLQVNIGDEAQKSGINPKDVAEVLEWMLTMGLTVRGLMAIPPIPEFAEQSRPHFQKLREIIEPISLMNPDCRELINGDDRRLRGGDRRRCFDHKSRTGYLWPPQMTGASDVLTLFPKHSYTLASLTRTKSMSSLSTLLCRSKSIHSRFTSASNRFRKVGESSPHQLHAQQPDRRGGQIQWWRQMV